MTFLVLAIICATCNHLLLRAFKDWRADLPIAILANYVVCCLIGICSTKFGVFEGGLWNKEWIWFAVLQGALLISSFYLMALTTQVNGVAIASLSSRLSIAIPTFAAFVLYNDSITYPKLGGVFLALSAIVLSSSDARLSYAKIANPLLPALLFILFGAHLTLAKYVQEHYLGNFSYHEYVTISFFFAVSLNILGLFLLRGRERNQFRWRDIAYGGILGIANYGSVYFLIKTLGVKGWESSTVFPTISICVIIASSIGGRAIFEERFSRFKTIAMATGLLAIAVINI